MDLTQQKLTKSEWEYLEIPVNKNEQRILNLIYNSFENVNLTENDALTLLLHMKISINEISFHAYLYENYFKNTIDKINKKYSLNYEDKEYKKITKKKLKLKSKDLIRIKNSSQKIETLKEKFILLKHISTFLKRNVLKLILLLHNY